MMHGRVVFHDGRVGIATETIDKDSVTQLKCLGMFQIMILRDKFIYTLCIPESNNIQAINIIGVFRFYIILRGKVSILHKDALEDVDLGDEGEPRTVDRTTLGNCLVTFGGTLTITDISDVKF